MINLMNKGLPQYIVIGGEPFKVYTDFRVWMRFCDRFEKWDKRSDMDISFLFNGRIPSIETKEDTKAILEFAYPPVATPKSSESESVRILDYELDGDYIYSSFLCQYGIDLTEADMHWHKFMALLRGLNRYSKLQEIMAHRCYEGDDKDLIKQRNMWALPVEMTEEEQREKQEFDDYFG